MPFIPHTSDDIVRMLERIGAQSIDDLFDEIPAALRAGELNLPPAMGEMELGRLLGERAAGDGRPLNFIGAGAYEHHIPAPVWAIATRGEFYSAYTPYQAEASQGTLQLIYEYQSMMCSLTGMEVSNASLYDGASALAEACLMAVRANRAANSRRILVPRTLNPTYAQVAHSIAGNQGMVFESVDFDGAAGRTALESLEPYAGQDVTALVIQQPEFLRLPGGGRRAQRLGAPQQGPGDRRGQPHFARRAQTAGAMGRARRCRAWGRHRLRRGAAARGASVRGRALTSDSWRRACSMCAKCRAASSDATVDTEGRPGFSLTLQAREQHIRRSKATSNICTNQGLLVTAATIYLSLLGAAGLERVARASLQRTADLVAPPRRHPRRQSRLHGAAFSRGRAAPGPAGRAGAVGPGAPRHIGGAGSGRAFSPGWVTRCWCAPPKPSSTPTSIRMPPRSPMSCTGRARRLE